MSFGKNLREARLAKKLTQRQLASMIGAKHNSISNWEKDHNKPGPDIIELICGALDVSPNYLFRGAVDSTKQVAPHAGGNLSEAKRKLLNKLDELTPDQLAAFEAMLDSIIRRRP